MPYVKLDTGILDSTLWVDRPAREVFITALLMAEPFALDAETPQIEVRSLELTGFIIPPGAYGFVLAAGVGIIRRAGIDDTEAGLDALERLGNEEADSRTPTFGGRRLVRVDGGYIVLNFDKYRQRDRTNAERQARYRQAQKLSGVTRDKRNEVTQAEAASSKQKQQALSTATTKVVAADEAAAVTRDAVDAYYRACTVALNQGMAENETVEGEWMPITASSQVDSVEWCEEGIPLEVAADLIRERCLAYRSTAQRRGPRGLRYFDSAVREQWERGKMTASEQRVQEAFE